MNRKVGPMQIKFLRFFLWLTIIFHCTFAECAQSEIIADRLLVAVGNNSFSQQELENYLFVKSFAVKKKNPTSLATNWRDNVTEFITDMILLGEAERVGGFQLEPTKLDDLAAKGQKLISAAVAAGYSVEKIKASTIRTNIQMALKVDHYRTSRQWESTAKEAPAWYGKLLENSKVRSFDGAEKYIKLN